MRFSGGPEPMPPDSERMVVERAGLMRIARRSDVPLETILDAVSASGDVLKRSGKSLTKRAGDFIVKSSEGALALQLVKHTMQRSRYRRGWCAAQYLAQHNIPAPRPVAHVEWGGAGIIWRHATVIQYIRGCEDVEHYYDARISEGASRTWCEQYLVRLAEAVNALTATGAIHTDLAGKNILTRDGETFCAIDLDGIVLGEPFDEERRLQCHVQLYDSFVDRCDDTLLAAFLKAMLPPEYPQFETWFARVKAMQAVRRARTVAAWEREGKLR